MHFLEQRRSPLVKENKMKSVSAHYNQKTEISKKKKSSFSGSIFNKLLPAYSNRSPDPITHSLKVSVMKLSDNFQSYQAENIVDAVY